MTAPLPDDSGPAGVFQSPIDGRTDQFLRDDIERGRTILVPCVGMGPALEQRVENAGQRL